MSNQDKITPQENDELMKLGTHAFANPDQYKTRKTQEEHQINPPDDGNAGSTAAY